MIMELIGEAPVSEVCFVKTGKLVEKLCREVFREVCLCRKLVGKDCWERLLGKLILRKLVGKTCEACFAKLVFAKFI